MHPSVYRKADKIYTVRSMHLKTLSSHLIGLCSLGSRELMKWQHLLFPFQIFYSIMEIDRSKEVVDWRSANTRCRSELVYCVR